MRQNEALFSAELGVYEISVISDVSICELTGFMIMTIAYICARGWKMTE